MISFFKRKLIFHLPQRMIISCYTSMNAKDKVIKRREKKVGAMRLLFVGVRSDCIAI